TLNAHVLAAIGDLNLKDVTPEHIDAVIEAARVKDGKPRPAVARNVARTLRAMFNAAIATETGGLEESPVQVSISRPMAGRGSQTRDRTATPAQVRALAALMPDHLALAVPLAAW